MKEPDNKPEEPLVRIGQGDYTRDLYPRDLYDGGFIGWLILLGIYFVVGFLIGRWTR